MKRIPHLVRSLFALSLLLPALASNVAAARAAELSRHTRLPQYAAPSAYTLFFDPRPERKSFSGTEKVEIVVRAATSEIVLNAAEVKVGDVRCQSLEAPDEPVQKLAVRYQTEEQKVYFHSAKTLSPGRYRLSFDFKGKLNEKLKGFFRERVVDGKGNASWLCATQMEPIDARRMFPCFDEPNYKATFAISVAVDEGQAAVSNSPVAEEKAEVAGPGHRKIVRFETTPVMPTYLVALVVGRIVPSEPVVVDGVPIRVWCVAGKEKMTEYSRTFAGKVLAYYNKYFGIPYYAKKLDLIGIPDFPNGAMENLGACTFREDLLLVDEKTISLDSKEQVALNVAHEMAHLWFGDLVTMPWWDDIWLNEAFAEWLSSQAVDILEPTWHYRNQFALEREQAMLSDSLRATQAIHAEIKDPDLIDQAFDEITYEKGAAVLFMLQNFLGPDVFQKGIHDYLAAHKFGSARPDDLFAALSSASGRDVTRLMQSWIYLKGFPLLKVGSEGALVNVSQKRFAFMGEPKNADIVSAWQIPLQVRSLQNSSPEAAADKVIFGLREGKIKTSQAAPFLMDAGGEGYFRVFYSAADLKGIMTRFENLSVLERASILSDQFYFALAGQIPVQQYLELTAHFRSETDPNVTSVICDQFDQMDLMIDDKARPQFTAFVRDRLGPLRKKFGWSSNESESALVKRQRAEVLLTLGTIGQDREVIDKARTLANLFFQNAKSTVVENELYEPMLKIVAYNGDEADYEKILDLWQHCATPERKQSTLMSLTAFQKPALIERTLKMCLTDKIERQDAPLVMAAIMEDRGGRGQAWEFFRKHIIRIVWRFPDHLMLNLVMAMNALGTQQQLDEVKAFFKKHPVPSQARGIDKIIEAIEIRVAFGNKNDLARIFQEEAKGL